MSPFWFEYLKIPIKTHRQQSPEINVDPPTAGGCPRAWCLLSFWRKCEMKHFFTKEKKSCSPTIFLFISVRVCHWRVEERSCCFRRTFWWHNLYGTLKALIQTLHNRLLHETSFLTRFHLSLFLSFLYNSRFSHNVGLPHIWEYGTNKKTFTLVSKHPGGNSSNAL